MEKKFTRNRSTWLAYILLALYAYFLNILGPITPFLHDEFHLSYTISSLHFSAFAAGILVVGLVGHVVIQRIGSWRSLSVGAIGLGLGALLLVSGRGPVITVGATFLMGCIGSLILAVVPATLSEEHGEMRAVAISEANVVGSLVASAAPFLVGWLAGLLIGWRLALIVAALLALLVGALLFRRDQTSLQSTASHPPKGRLPSQFWYYWVTLVLAVAIEFCMVYWSADYLERELHMAKAGAAQAVSLFLAGMILGRLVSSRLLQVFTTRQVVFTSILLGIAGFLFYWCTTSALVGMVSLAVTGLGVASLYPLILSMAIGAAPGSETQAGAGATLASGVAILVLPLVLGRLADMSGLRAAFAVIAILFIAMLFMIGVAKANSRARTVRQAQKTPSCESTKT